MISLNKPHNAGYGCCPPTPTNGWDWVYQTTIVDWRGSCLTWKFGFQKDWDSWTVSIYTQNDEFVRKLRFPKLVDCKKAVCEIEYDARAKRLLFAECNKIEEQQP